MVFGPVGPVFSISPRLSRTTSGLSQRRIEAPGANQSIGRFEALREGEQANRFRGTIGIADSAGALETRPYRVRRMLYDDSGHGISGLTSGVAAALRHFREQRLSRRRQAALPDGAP